MFFKSLLLIAAFFVSTISLASVLPEGSHRAGLQDEFDAFQEAAKDGSYLELNECRDGYRLWSQYQQTFSRVSEAQDWCNGLLVQFNINVEFLFDHCGWTQGGRYGNYTYATNFLVYYDFPGAPRFYFEQYSCDGNGNAVGGGY